MLTWEVSNLVDDGYRATFDAVFRDGEQVVAETDFNIVVPTETGIVEDELGRYITVSGKRVLPVRIVSEEWRPRPEDPADPWARVAPHRDVDAAVQDACAAHAARLEAR